MIPTIYVQAASKKALNVLLAAGADPLGVVECMLETTTKPLREMPDGTVVKIFQKRDYHGTPIARTYGNVQRRLGKLVVV